MTLDRPESDNSIQFMLGHPIGAEGAVELDVFVLRMTWTSTNEEKEIMMTRKYLTLFRDKLTAALDEDTSTAEYQAELEGIRDEYGG